VNVLKALAEAEPTPYWLADAARPEPLPALVGAVTCDLAVIGGGYSGLWTALRAKERNPSLDVVLVEAGRVGGAASGRNGGFCAASITHGLGNGLERWPDEIADLERIGHENLDGIQQTVARYGIDCDFERTGEMHVATEPYQVDYLQEEAEVVEELGGRAVFLDTGLGSARRMPVARRAHF
jgi:glycine/D-amino acid oxidase-like deaminating enzyme